MTRDEKFMGLALRLGRKGLGRTSPNPPVGAVVVKGAKIVGRGFHRAAGTAHAEIEAIEDAGKRARGATLYVTLEPCNHTGKTPPCTAAIIEAGIARVVVGSRDPNPHVSARGAQMLGRKGIEVALGVRSDECDELIETFAKHVAFGLPFVVAKAAMSLDGKIATRTGHSRWISSGASLKFAHRLRDEADAVLVGSGTVLADDPHLTARLSKKMDRQPLRVVLDTRLDTPLDSKLVKTAKEGPVIVACSKRGPKTRARPFEEAGVEVLRLPTEGKRVALLPLLKELGKRGVMSLLVEGGARVHGSFFDLRLVDRVYMVISPRIIGGAEAPGPVAGKGAERVGGSLMLERVRILRKGPDLVVTGKPGL